MEMFSIKSLALKWFYFSCVGSVSLYAEFCHLWFKQLGFSPKQIGFTTLMGGQHFLVLFILLLADKFRARKAVSFMAIIGVTLTGFMPLLPLVVSLPTCFTERNQISRYRFDSGFVIFNNGSMHSGSNMTNSSPQNSIEEASKMAQSVPWLSKLFILMTVSRSLNVMFDTVAASLGNLAVVTYLKERSSNYGAYFMWYNIGGAVSIFTVAFLSWSTRITVCGIEDYGYSLAFIVAACMALFSMVSLPWFEFEYDQTKTINWADLKSHLFNFHYVFMFLIIFYAGLCCSFQIYWEFWYLDGLQASPLLMGGAALIRRPLLALSAFVSGNFIRKIGELKTVSLGLLLYSLSFLALSFTRIPWFVIGIDIFQAAAYGLILCSMTVHFSKAGSKENSGFILGLVEINFAIGFDAGALTLMGVLFDDLGTRMTLLIYSLTTCLVLFLFVFHIYFSKHVHGYEKLKQTTDD
ncbi:uncharacterized protein LOC114537529 [Dendronephthya gigantea]|uniref:uncharacterized protein LOC114537529 n=1 Tax=Dendronephthya gigantea TaxID=151771 RepID=UPI0010697994|nr:uncharacterized protein LOC114537529 [Dendronephthya gigantea]